MQGLYEDSQYLFRVAAVNENGNSEYLEASNPIVAKMQFGKENRIATQKKGGDKSAYEVLNKPDSCVSYCINALEQNRSYMGSDRARFTKFLMAYYFLLYLINCRPGWK